MRRNCRTVRDGIRAQAEETAASLISQSRAAVNPSVTEPEEPMKRYIYSLPSPACCPDRCSVSSAESAVLDRILETLCYQNQLLLDLLAAVNSLTAAVLTARSKA